LSRTAKALSIIDKINEWCGVSVSYLSLVLILAICYEVTARYVFNAPTIWAQETGSYLFAAIWLFAGGYTLRHDAHVRVDVLYNRLTPRGKAIIDTITSPVFFGMMGVLIWVTAKYAGLSINAGEHSPSLWGPPIYVIKTLIPIGGCLLLLQGIARFIRNLYRAITAKELT
jgi:TRAP-type mannitol/chloroaromatic compound transport system permease small subunit